MEETESVEWLERQHLEANRKAINEMQAIFNKLNARQQAITDLWLQRRLHQMNKDLE